MSLEAQWRHYRSRLIDDSVLNIIRQGERIVGNINLDAETNGNPERIVFVRMVEPQ